MVLFPVPVTLANFFGNSILGTLSAPRTDITQSASSPRECLTVFPDFAKKVLGTSTGREGGNGHLGGVC